MYSYLFVIQSFFTGNSLIQRTAEDKENQKPEQLWASNGQSLQGATLGMNEKKIMFSRYIQAQDSNSGDVVWVTAYPWPEGGSTLTEEHKQ